MISNMYVIDLETDGLLDTMTTIHCAVAKDFKTGQVYSYGPEGVEDFIYLINNQTVIGHNIISFDLPALQRFFHFETTMEIDTLVMSRLLNPDRERPQGLPQRVGPHSLEAWGMRLGFPKGDFKEFEEYSEDMLEYCIRDVEVTDKVYRELLKEMLV